MSAFLGPIHHWLYNKVLWHEHLLLEIYAEIQLSGAEAHVIKSEAESRFGQPTTDALETVIDGGNIHGWLQLKIESLEKRMAYAITKGLHDGKMKLETLEKLYFENGVQAAQRYGAEITTPELAFKAMNDFLLDGMPCDRVHQLVASSADKLVYEKISCVHTPMWQSVGGDIEVFNTLRQNWLEGFCGAKIKYVSYGNAQFGFESVS